MATLNIGGQRVQVGDEFLKLSPEEQQATVDEIAATLPKAATPAEAETPVGVNDLVRSAATGVPVIGGVLNKLNAATNATLAPVVEPFLSKGEETLDQPTWSERYAKSLEIQNKRDKKFAEESPIIDTAAKITGGVAGTIPAVLAAPRIFGAIGTLPQMVTRGAGSGAALSAADAAVRGEDVPTAIGVGGLFGAGGPLVARGVGKVVDAVRPKPAPVPQNTVRVGNTEVPMRPDQLSGDVRAAGEAEAALRGGLGEPAQRVAQGFDELQGARIREASDEISAGLDPTGTMARVAPQDAGAKVVDDLVAAEAQRLAAEQGAVARTAAEGERIRSGMGGGQVLADSPAAAAEAMGAGVQRARDAAVTRRRGLYDAVRDEPGAFDPDVVTGLSGNIRARLGTGERPEFVDPETSKRSASALRLLDSMGGLGLFGNRVQGPVGPVAAARATPEAAVPAAASEAEQALQELVAQGINPARARAAVAGLPGGDRLSAGVLAPHDVAVANGTSVRVAPKVVEASALKTSADTGYPRELQPRDRGRAASSVQINDMARNLNPARLGASSEADRGAPIIGADGIVESGNGRVLAIRQAYAEGGPSGQRYRDWLQSQGVDVSGYREPVLVRERATPMTPQERQAFTVGANQSATLSMSAPERALADAKILTPDTLSLIRNPGDLGAADNRDFVRAFMQGVPAAERGALVTSSGELSAEGLTRVRNAVLGRAYGDTPVLTRIAESTHDDVKSISNGLMAAAPEWAQLRARINAGEVPASLDVTGDLVDAVSRTARIRGRGQGLADAQAQGDAFAKQSPASESLQRLFYDADGKKAASGAQVGNALRNYAQEAGKVNAAPGLDLGLAPVSADDILRVVSKNAGAPAALAKEVAEAAAPATKGSEIGDVGLKEMDAARKRLVTLYSDARKDYQQPNDARIMGRILHEFDNAILEAFENGRFSGDSARAAQLLRDARASHAAYRQTFTSRGGQDDIGRAVEKILGRYTDTRATPDEIARMSYGSLAEPGGGPAARVAQRLRTIVGDTSPEWGAYKQGLLSHLIDTPAGTAPRSASATADRIDKFLSGTQGKVLADVVLSRAERDALRGYAANLRATEPVDLKSLGTVDKVIARISGRDGGMPMTPGAVVDLLFSRSGRGDKNTSVPVAARLKRDLTPEGWTAVRQGMWEKLTNAGEGKIAFGPQALSQRLHEFLNESGSGLAKVLYSPAERQQMAALANVYRQMIPPKGTTNPSGTAWALNRMAEKANNHVAGMLGGTFGGPFGAALGYALTGGTKSAVNARNARDAVRTFYGAQPPRPGSGRTPRAPIILSQSAAPLAANQDSR